MDKKKVYRFDKTEDVEEMQRLAYISDSDLSDANDDSSSISDLEQLEEYDEHSDTEHESYNSEENEEIENENSDANVLFGKDGITKWNMDRPRQAVRTSSHNIMTHLPGVKQVANNAKTALQCWELLLPDELIVVIVENTNNHILSKRDQFSRERDCKPTDSIEIKAFIGLLYMAGVHRNSKLNTQDLWATDGSGIELFRLTMSRNRFHFLLQYIRFDDKQTRNERKMYDKLSPIRQIFDIFVHRCEKNYSVGEYVMIDEMLPAFRGRCSFRQYIPSKSNKYGIKVYSLVDAKTWYTLNMEIYVGQQPDGPFKVSNSSHYVNQFVEVDVTLLVITGLPVLI